LTSAALPADSRDMGSLAAIIPSSVPGGPSSVEWLEPPGTDEGIIAARLPISLESAGKAAVGQHYELTSNQLMDLANSIDLDSLTWPFSPIGQGFC
jgi:proline utilization trans-activator